LTLTLERYQLKTFRDVWMVYDCKMGVFAAFSTHAMAVKSCIVLSSVEIKPRLAGLTWFTHSQLIHI
jgi:hypothetical protein